MTTTTGDAMTHSSLLAGPAAGTEPVHATFLRRVADAPDAPALIDEDHTWTYAELDRLAGTLAGALRDRGVEPGDPIGVCLDHGVAAIAALLAAARLGAVHLPLGARTPGERLRAVAATTGLRCLIGAPPVAVLGEPEELPLPGVVAAVRTGDRDRRAPEGTFYAVLTSGSSGTPKAVAVGEESLGIVQRTYRELTGLRPGDRHSLLMNAAFDPHLMEVWSTLCAGATLAVAPAEARSDPHALTEWWRAAGITVAILPTPLAELVLRAPWPGGLRLRHLVIGGDRLRRAPGPDVTAVVHNAYGPAEATVMTTVHTMPPGTSARATGQAPPIGLPVPGAVVAVTDPDGRPVPRGEAGELRIGGRGLALGYFDAARTRERFVTDGTARWYRTGDRVVMRPDGVLDFLGRFDRQVKINGVRVELSEIETAFERDPEVRRAAAVLRRTADGSAQPLVFVQPAAAASPDPARLRAAAAAWLPPQALPAVVDIVDAFPLDANGKIDETALLARRVAAAEDPDPGASPAEVTVLRLCRDVLGNPAVTLADNFTAAGGNSLAAARLLVALEAEFGVPLRAGKLLRQPDLRHIALLAAPAAATETRG